MPGRLVGGADEPRVVTLIVSSSQTSSNDDRRRPAPAPWNGVVAPAGELHRSRLPCSSVVVGLWYTFLLLLKAVRNGEAAVILVFGIGESADIFGIGEAGTTIPVNMPTAGIGAGSGV